MHRRQSCFLTTFTTVGVLGGHTQRLLVESSGSFLDNVYLVFAVDPPPLQLSESTKQKKQVASMHKTEIC